MARAHALPNRARLGNRHTAAGSFAAIVLARELMIRSRAKAVPTALGNNPPSFRSRSRRRRNIMLATALGPNFDHAWVDRCTARAGLVSAPMGVNFAALGKNFVMPLLLSPVLAIATGALLY